jgi:MBG domain-containing protein
MYVVRTDNASDNINASTAHASASYGGDANHNGDDGSASFTIERAPLTVTADDQSKFDGNLFTAFTSKIAGFVNGETAAVVSGSVSYGGTAVGATARATNSVFTVAPGAPPTTKPSNLVWNTAKGGQTIPLKFNVYAAGVERTSLADIAAFQQAQVTCVSSTNTDPVELTTTGGTSLRYDTTALQWVQNWATPKVNGTTCYRAFVKFADGSTIEAFFQLSK